MTANNPQESTERKARRTRSKENVIASETKVQDARRPSSSAEAGSSNSAASQSTNADSEIPHAVRDRLLREGRDYFFKDGASAFRDLGDRLTTQSENAELVRLMVLVAKERGWSGIAIAGSERFRRAAWEAAEGAGLRSRGYRPTEGERARAEAGKRRVSDGALNGSPPASVASQDPAKADPSSTRADTPPPHDELIRGTLIEHGRAKYLFDSGKEESYFVRVRTKQGERTVWGKNLERALEFSETRPLRGDPVGLQLLGRVSVGKAKDGARKDVVRQAYRNRWVVERAEFFEARLGAAQTLRDSRIPPSEGVDRNPVLLDAYVHVRAAEHLAERRMSHAADRAQFVGLVREALAAQIERGDALPRARLRSAITPTNEPPELSMQR